ncbi:response regulator transcription factor [Tepidibacillus marianensis]|uniref:response regulator transcription factor n=1 Tax=Tepidibacillus marianensis TaxID=3131995 RepID=UPI0030D038CF
MKKILVVEDEISISRVLKAYLTKEGYSVELVYSGEEAIEKFQENNLSLVLLDVMLPEMDGWTVLNYIRERSSCPVIMLTALGQISQKLTGLNQGADDYITKPFDPLEVVARVNAVLRRSTQLIDQESIRYYGTLKIDFKAHRIYLHGLEIEITPRDLSLLLFLARHPNQTFTREQLIEQVWGIDYEGSDRAVDLAIKRIRKVLDLWPSTEGEIKTLRGMGYQFSVYEKE